MRGVWKTIEAIIGGLIILLFAAALSSNYMNISPSVPVHGYRALSAAYDKGEFRAYAAAMNYSGINEMVEATGYLQGYNHTVQVCSQGGSCAGIQPSKENVWVAGIMVAGDQSYQPMEVILYMYRE
jgi:hypothetical protein